MFFNLSIQTGQIPWQWNTSHITPIYKKSSKNLTQNYRPIALTSVLCRILEKIICNHVIHHLLNNSLLSSCQHGFLPHRSTVTQLLSTLNNWISGHSTNKTIHVIYTDLSKAFDRVSHEKLLEVILSYGINGNLFRWLKSFLTERVQQVIIEQSKSSPLEVTSGVPQGSVIGPLLFLLYIDDITKLGTENTTINLFADDAKVFSSDSKDLQNVLDQVCIFLRLDK